MPRKPPSEQSLKNLTYREGRPKSEDIWGQPKKRRMLTLTSDGFDGCQVIAGRLGFSSLSDFLENLGRGKFLISKVAPTAPPSSPTEEHG